MKLSNAVQYQVKPFGLSLHGPWMNTPAPDNLYQYSGKELQPDHGLGWLDFGARMYMPEAGRFTTPDRFSEKYYSLAPYQYAANNPTLFTEYNDARLVQGNASVHFTEQVRVQINPTLGGVKKLYYPNHHINIEMTVAFNYKK
ncbi:MAG: RHS repeat-associated core domain-containing protein [Bacteroidia bacterium]|nr:RHS repeat-associated core domain-containing protein [Bacteroidia bacterium]